MADIPVITGNFPDGTPFAFTLNGAATQRQMERLIELTSILAKQKTNPKTDPAQAAQIEALKANTAQINKNTDATATNNKETLNFQEALLNLSTVSNIARGNLAAAFNGINKPAAAVAAAMGGMVGQLFDYSGQLGQAMQRGVAGGVMDFAIAAKTGGLTLGQFSKALDESGGSFAMLGNGATDGAKQFGSLVSEVRYATASVGNLGLSNEQLAMLTAQQVKVAVAQGFRGRAANAQVIENTKVFSGELDNLANRTGKSVLELVAAAQKLALDPIVSNFVATARSGKAELSKAMQSYAANLEGLFGKAGEQLRTDALQNALAGLPLTMTEAGKNLQLASASVYGELQNQANRAAAGQSITEEDTKRLRALVLREVDARRTELTYMANLKGPAGDAAKQLLALAQEARSYNTEDGAKRRKEDEAAKAFVASTNQLRANLQQLAIPILNLLNGVNWTLLTDILRGFTTVLELAMTPLSVLGKILSNTGLGSVVGGLLGVVTVASMVMAGFALLKTSLATLTASILKNASAIGVGNSVVQSTGRGVPNGGPNSTTGKGRPNILSKDFDATKQDKTNRLAELRSQGKSPKEALDSYNSESRLVQQSRVQDIKDARKNAIAAQSGQGSFKNIAVPSGASANTALLVTGLVTSMLGGALSMVGDSKLAEDADSTLGKVASISGKILEWSGTILAVLPVFSSLVTAMPAIKLAVLGFSSLIKTKVTVAAVSLLASFGALNLGLIKTAAALTLVSAAPGGGIAAKILGILGTAVAGVSTLLTKIPGVFGTAVTGMSTLMSKIPGVFGTAVTGVSALLSKIPGVFGTAVTGISALLSKIPGVFGTAVTGMSTLMSKIPGVFGTAVTGVSALLTKIPGVLGTAVTGVSALFSSLMGPLSMVTAFLSQGLMVSLVAVKAGFGMVTAFLSKGLMVALAAIASPALAVAAAVAAAAGAVYLVVKYWDNIVGLFSNIGKKLKDVFSGIFGIGQDESAEVSDKQATTESAATLGGVSGGMAGAAIGAGFGSTLLGVGAVPGGLIGGALGGALGTSMGYGAANLFTSDEPGNVSKEITDTQTTAIDSNNMRESENTKQLSQLNKNIETLVASSDANLMVNGKIASISDNNSRYLRGAAFGSA